MLNEAEFDSVEGAEEFTDKLLVGLETEVGRSLGVVARWLELKGSGEVGSTEFIFRVAVQV